MSRPEGESYWDGEWSTRVKEQLVEAMPEKCRACSLAGGLLVDAFVDVMNGSKSADQAEVDVALNISVRCGSDQSCPPASPETW